LLLDLVNDLEPYVDDTFAPLAERITALSLDNYRVAGFVLLHKCKSPTSRGVLEAALSEDNVLIVRAALAALAHAKDPASIPALRLYLAKHGKERLLALAALRTAGDDGGDLDAALAQYVESARRVTALMAYRKGLFERLYGGTSFKLTPAERKNYERQYARAKVAERDAIFDTTTFRNTLDKFTDAQAEQFAKFVAAADDRAAASMAFAVLPHLTPAQRQRFAAAMATAKLPQLRTLTAP
jgi:HEAT repeat protein